MNLIMYICFIIMKFIFQTKETALHWACKRGYEKISKLLLENHSDSEAKDMVLFQY